MKSPEAHAARQVILTGMATQSVIAPEEHKPIHLSIIASWIIIVMIAVDDSVVQLLLIFMPWVKAAAQYRSYYACNITKLKSHEKTVCHKCWSSFYRDRYC